MNRPLICRTSTKHLLRCQSSPGWRQVAKKEWWQQTDKTFHIFCFHFDFRIFATKSPDILGSVTSKALGMTCHTSEKMKENLCLFCLHDKLFWFLGNLKKLKLHLATIFNFFAAGLELQGFNLGNSATLWAESDRNFLGARRESWDEGIMPLWQVVQNSLWCVPWLTSLSDKAKISVQRTRSGQSWPTASIREAMCQTKTRSTAGSYRPCTDCRVCAGAAIRHA